MIRNLLKKDYFSFLKTSIFSFLESIFAGSNYIVLIFILNDILNQDFTVVKAMGYLGLLLFLFALRVVFSVKAYNLGMKFGFNKSAELRILIASHLKDISLSHFSKKDVGSITKTVLEDVNNVENIFTHLYVNIVSLCVLTIFIIGVLIWLNLTLGLIFLAILVFAIPLLILSKRSLEKRAKKRVASQNDLVSSIIEYLRGVKELKLFNKEGKNFQNIDTHLKKYEKASLNIERNSVLTLSFLLSFLEIAFMCLIAFSCYLLKIEQISVYIVIFFLILIMRFSQLAKVFLVNYGAIKIMQESAKEIIELFKFNKISFEKNIVVNNWDIEFKEVSFAYKNKIILNNLNFKIKQNSFVAIVGSSGSGKSTIINLILRYWDCSKGEICLGNQNIKKIEPEYLMSHISMVFQDVHLFEGTVYENIAIAKENTNLEEVIQSAKKAQCHDFIMALEDTYDTKLSQGGSNLSAGQKQRISISRAILKDPTIIIFDEATASLDALNESYIQQAIDELTKNKTVIVIAHKLLNIVNADKIYVLSNKEIVEEGTHNNLIEQNGVYKQMWEYQEKNSTWVIE